jgi:MYXO-CTERM domain-containing protein
MIMIPKASLVRRPMVGLVALALAVGTASVAQAAVHPLSGNARFQIGNGLPIPITFIAPPNGRVLPVPGAAVTQTTGADPRQMAIQPGQLNAAGTPVNIGVFLANSNVFQVNTSIIIDWPGNPAVFAASGRTGAATVTFCAGQVVTPAGNPGCTNPANGTINGLMRYTRTTNQFGGPAQGAAGGAANVGLRVAAGAPCAYAGGVNPGCQVIFALATPNPTGAQGGAFGFINGTAGAAPATGRFHMTVQANGVITGITPTGLGPGLANPATSYGAPWTTGMLTVSVTANVGPNPEVFVMSGADNRVNGVGTISMVSGSVSDRGTSGPNANRGWLNLNVGPSGTVPAMSVSGYAAAAGLIVLAGAFALRRRIFG